VLGLCTGYYVQVAAISDGGLVDMKVEEEKSGVGREITELWAGRGGLG
jgi:hypothetical protein